MPSTYRVRDLVLRLPEDEWRRNHSFSSDMTAVHQVLFHPYATDAQRQEALAAWLQRQQPCLFGRIAAAGNALHYIFLDDNDLRDSDQHIAERIQTGVRAWRQRSVSPRSGVSSPAHGLLVSIISERVSLAEPSDVLQQLSHELLGLWGCRATYEPQGQVYWETLYLENPADGTFVQFSFSVDFFAAAGDGRWWRDHRLPGGVAFTANSVGHMRRYREWYEGKTDQRGWLLETAMGTIALASETPYGKATWLRPLADGKTFAADVTCPVANSRFSEYDWTRYAGHLHTDHAVRPEFFHASPEKPGQTTGKEWVQDFQYLYDRTSRDHIRFVEGVTVSKQEVYEVVGKPEDYVELASPRKPKPKRQAGENIASPDRAAEVEALLDVCRGWLLNPEERAQLDSGAA